MRVNDLVFGRGDRVSAWGRFVAAEDSGWLDVARVDNLMVKPPDWRSDRSVRLIGADADMVPTGSGSSTVAGCIRVIGIWRGDAIDVESQSSEAPSRPSSPRWEQPPCAPPRDGWPHGKQDERLRPQFGDLESSGAVVATVQFRPSRDQVVLAVAATDVDTAIRRLAPQLPNRLYVVRSHFSRDQLDQVGRALTAHADQWRLEVWGSEIDAQAQPFTHAKLFRVTPDLADWADTLPGGLLRLEPSLARA